MKNKVESFELDHTKVTAPYIRRIGTVDIKEYMNKNGEAASITKFDLRFTQPNKKFMPNDAIHSLEHLLAVTTREYTDEIIDISPMGCRTGFYLIAVGNKSVEWIVDIVTKSLNDILKMNEIPGCKEISCGNYLEHDLDGAKLWAERFLSIPSDKLAIINRQK